MLRLDFINVGDGDAILIREYSDRQTGFTMLVDCGRAEVLPFAGSRRQSAADYLQEQGVLVIDLLIITHLHPDHFGGLELLNRIKINRMLSAYLSCSGSQSVREYPAKFGSTSTAGLYKSLTAFAQDFAMLKRQGCDCKLATSGAHDLTSKLRMQIALPQAEVLSRQKAAFNALEEAKVIPEDVLYPISKERNNASLRLTLEYAKRRIILPGDAYGAFWENEPDAAACDIFKLPHHGDDKSLTDLLLSKLHPSFSVISGLKGEPSKHRPAAETINLLNKYDSPVVCLENDAVCGLDAVSLKAAVFYIQDKGEILYEPVY
ncbi:MAG: MBL fold metallo-hydrolase [Clostridiales bacterium]|nr:MBL fold metallo-hydrolase [Clostridiales bacterium]